MFQFNPEFPISNRDPFYNNISDPDLNDRVHVVVCVVPASTVSQMRDSTVQKIRDVRAAASRMNEDTSLLYFSMLDFTLHRLNNKSYSDISEFSTYQTLTHAPYVVYAFLHSEVQSTAAVVWLDLCFMSK